MILMNFDVFMNFHEFRKSLWIFIIFKNFNETRDFNAEGATTKSSDHEVVPIRSAHISR